MGSNKGHRRIISKLPVSTSFSPSGIPLTSMDSVNLKISELEAMHLVDLKGFKQEDAARNMGVSRKTLWKDLKSGRRIVTDALINGKKINIDISG
ncbi:MAG: DNA-binding protein [Candidatus Altiarchaeales archaeon]|nr:MAG: DUF134 domain-containing protein [Methanophagales archaeon]RLI86786.1 MAG: DNA-binding protein [Candidatus Altiarchaeales archaeon]HDI72621.1 DUF134 domain-containing protein [Candidatus Altiarchaeales archaeon]